MRHRSMRPARSRVSVRSDSSNTERCVPRRNHIPCDAIGAAPRAVRTAASPRAGTSVCMRVCGRPGDHRCRERGVLVRGRTRVGTAPRAERHRAQRSGEGGARLDANRAQRTTPAAKRRVRNRCVEHSANTRHRARGFGRPAEPREAVSCRRAAVGTPRLWVRAPVGVGRVSGRRGSRRRAGRRGASRRRPGTVRCGSSRPGRWRGLLWRSTFSGPRRRVRGRPARSGG